MIVISLTRKENLLTILKVINILSLSLNFVYDDSILLKLKIYSLTYFTIDFIS